jgi:hypothetical protein
LKSWGTAIKPALIRFGGEIEVILKRRPVKDDTKSISAITAVTAVVVHESEHDQTYRVEENWAPDVLHVVDFICEQLDGFILCGCILFCLAINCGRGLRDHRF